MFFGIIIAAVALFLSYGSVCNIFNTLIMGGEFSVLDWVKIPLCFFAIIYANDLIHKV